MRYRYEAYGLELACDDEIPGLPESAGCVEPVDLTIQLGEVPHLLNQLRAYSSELHYQEAGDTPSDPPYIVVSTLFEGAYLHFRFHDRIDFVLDRKSTRLWAEWAADVDPKEVYPYLIGPILGFALRLKGVTCLHAGAVMVEGRALAVAGASGAGKSTLVAAWAARGYPVVTDDVLPLQLAGEQALCAPGIPRLHLYPQALAAVARLRRDLPKELPRITPDWDKRVMDLRDSTLALHRGTAPLGSIYLLDWSQTSIQSTRIEILSPAAAVPILAAMTYRTELLDTEMRRDEFAFLGQLVARVPVKRVRPVDNLDTVSAVADAILADFQRTAAGEKR